MTMFWGLSYNIVIIVNNTILYTWKRLNGWILKVFSTPKNCNYMRWCVNLPHCSNYFTLSVWLLSCVRLFVTPWTAAHQTSLSFTISQSLHKVMSLESVMPSQHLNICCSLFLLPSIFPSIRIFSNELAVCIMWPKYWSFSFSISPSNEYSELISFRIDWFDLLAVQGTLKSFLQFSVR